jgi:hypothetical protein
LPGYTFCEEVVVSYPSNTRQSKEVIRRIEQILKFFPFVLPPPSGGVECLRIIYRGQEAPTVDLPPWEPLSPPQGVVFY